jgi:2-polyprenyl-3-methyl-5-hydroxy-6-metoxy-1,4-benzoquinol methylase
MKSNIPEDAKELRRIWGAFRSSRVLMTANNYRIFDYLAEPQSARTVSKKLGTDLRATEILLDALAGMGLLVKQKSRYLNTASASHLLVSGTPHYQGDIIRHADILWKNWSGLDEVMKTGQPSHKAHDQEAFILGMHNIASLKAGDVIKAIGLKGVRTALDLGGGPGTYSIEMAKKGVRVTLFDHPETIAIARKVVEKERITGITFASGDFLVDDIGTGYDLIFLSQILHAYSEEDNLRLLKKCGKALNSQGRIVIQEFYIDEDRTRPLQSALFSVNMLVNTEGGRCYPPQEIKNWFSKIGLQATTERFLDDTILITGTYSTS